MAEHTETTNTALKNEARAPAGAVANARNMGLLGLVVIWVEAQAKAAFPVMIDPASQLPVDGAVEGQMIVVLVAVVFATTVLGFLGNVWKNVAAETDGSQPGARLGKFLAGLLP